MKKKLSALVFVFIAFVAVAKAQIPEKTSFKPPVVSPIIRLQVTNVTLRQDSLVPNGNAHMGYYKATITSAGRGMVYYRWIITGNHLPNTPVQPYIINDSIVVSGSGTDEVFHHVPVAAHSPAAMMMQTITPNQVNSNTCVY